MRHTLALAATAALALAACGGDDGNRAELEAFIAENVAEQHQAQALELVMQTCDEHDDITMSMTMHMAEADGNQLALDMIRTYCPERVERVFDD